MVTSWRLLKDDQVASVGGATGDLSVMCAVNTISATGSMTLSRVKQIVKAFNGDIPTGYLKCKSIVTAYELVTITMTRKKEEQNKALALLKLVDPDQRHELLRSELSDFDDFKYYKCTSTSDEFMRYNNIDEYILVALDALGIMSLDYLPEGLAARRIPGRPNNDVGNCRRRINEPVMKTLE